MNNEPLLDLQLLQHRLARAAAGYEQHAVLEQAVAQHLFERLDLYTSNPKRVVDLGAGTGRDAAKLKARYPKADVIALDISLPMLREARRQLRWRRPLWRVVGDARQLPLADHSVDILHANLSFQWVEDLPRLFGECARVLRPEGLLLFSSLGPDTLGELRAAWAAIDQTPHVHSFLDMHDLGDAVLAAGLRDPVLEVERYCLTYAEPLDLLRELKGLGATQLNRDRRRSLTGKKRFQHMLAAYEAYRQDGRIPAGWEVILAHARGAAAGQPQRAGQGEIARIPLPSLRGTRPR